MNNNTPRSAEEFAEETYYDLDMHDEGGYLGIDTKEYARLLDEYKNEHTASLQKELDKAYKQISTVEANEKIAIRDLHNLQAENKRLREGIKQEIIAAYNQGTWGNYLNGEEYFHQNESVKDFLTNQEEEQK